MKKPHIMVIDPGVIEPELGAFNHLVKLSPLPLTYHLPALFGIDTLKNDNEGVAGIVIFGSASSVNERTEWQKSLEGWLMPHLDQGIPTMGICYGHQMLAHMFGGKVSYMFPDQKKLLGFREVTLNADPLWGTNPIVGKVCVSHNEAVMAVPDSMKVLGASSTVPIESLRHATLPIWSFQFHPEATPEFLGIRGYCGSKEECHEFGYSLLKYFLEFVNRNK